MSTHREPKHLPPPPVRGDGWEQLWERSALTLSIRRLKDPLLSLLSADVSATQQLFDLYVSGIQMLTELQDTNIDEILLEEVRRMRGSIEGCLPLKDV